MTIPGWALEHVAVTGLLIALVAVLCRLVSNRPALQHALWLVVLARFIVPPWLVWPLPVPDWLLCRSTAIELAGVPAETNLASQQGEPLTEPSDESTAEPLAEPAATLIMSEPAVVAPLEAPLPRLPASPPGPERGSRPVGEDQPQVAFAAEVTRDRLLYAGWLIGGLVIAWRRIAQIARYQRMANRAAPAPDQLRSETARLAAFLGLRPIPVLVTDEISSPLVWCLGRAKLIWPAALSGSVNLGRWNGVLCHELAHVRRRDHWTAWLELAVGLVWWWNPLAWFVVRRVRDSAELACDAVVIDVLPDERRAYAEAFLELSGPRRPSQPAPALGAQSRNRKTFERRLSMILSQRVISNLSLPGLAVAVGLAVVAIPSWSLSHADQPAAAEEASTEAAPSSESGNPAASADNTGLPKVETGDSATSSVFEMEAFVDMPMVFARPYDTITRVQIDQPDVLSVTPRTVHELELVAKKAGTAKVILWCGERELTKIQVNTRLGAIAIPEKSTAASADDAADADMIVDAFVNMPTVQIMYGTGITRVEVDHPEILSVRLEKGNALRILAKKVGTATFTVWGELQGSETRLVRVQVNALQGRTPVAPTGTKTPPAPPDRPVDRARAELDADLQPTVTFEATRAGPGLGGPFRIVLDPDLQPDMKLALPRYKTVEIACPDHKINHVTTEGDGVVLVRKQTSSGFQVSGKKEGTAKINLWDDEKQFASVEIKVVAADARPLPNPNGQPMPGPGRAAAPAAPPQHRTVQAAESGGAPGLPPSAEGLKSAQVDVASMGTAIIEAKGEIELASNEIQSLRRARDRVHESVKEGDLIAASIKLSTAEQKLAFLIKLAQAAYDSASRELNLENQKFKRIEQLRANDAISSQRLDQAQRDLNAVQDRVTLIETIPGVRPAQK